MSKNVAVTIIASSNLPILRLLFSLSKNLYFSSRRVFLDGLLRAGTGYSVEASIEILKGKDLSSLEQQLVFLSLGNAKHVNNEAIKAAAVSRLISVLLLTSLFNTASK